MYTVKVGNDVIYSPALGFKGRVIQSPVLKIEANTASTLEFTCPDANSKKAMLQMLRPEIKVYDGSNRVFRGRIVNGTNDFRLSRKIHAEGELAYLQDVIVRPYDVTKTPAQMFEYLLTAYNAQLPAGSAEKRFEIGNCTVTGTSKQFKGEDYKTVFAVMADALIKEYGGYLIPRYVIEGGVEVNYLDWLAEPGTGTQRIQYAHNLLDLTQQEDASPLFTAMVAHAEINGNTVTRTVTASAAIIGKYGYIESSKGYSDIDSTAALEAAATKDLNAAIAETEKTSVTAKAVDMTVIPDSGENDSLTVCKKYAFISAPHDYAGTTLRLMRAEIKLQEPGKSVYTFESLRKSLAKTTASNKAGTAKAESTAQAAESTAKAASAAVGRIADYIVETGTTDGWAWRKWNSGRAECICQDTKTVTSMYKHNDNLYSEDAVKDYPANLFTSNVRLFASANGTTNTGLMYWLGSYAEPSLTQAKYRIFRIANVSASTGFIVNLHAVGRWK